MAAIESIEQIKELGEKCDGMTVVVRAAKHNIESLGESRANYRIELPWTNDDVGPPISEGVRLIPFKTHGTVADSTLSRDDYRYTHGGAMFVAAVDMAKEIARALGLPK